MRPSGQLLLLLILLLLLLPPPPMLLLLLLLPPMLCYLLFTAVQVSNGDAVAAKPEGDCRSKTLSGTGGDGVQRRVLAAVRVMVVSKQWWWQLC